MRNSLKSARIQAGYTQQQVAVRLGTSQQTVSKHETEKTTPQHFKTLRGYEKLLGVPAEELFPDIFNT
jgi:DNA-binding XRE family transcriptional regulator